MQTTAADSLIGRTLEGRYRILERIARGGMSTVYAAVDARLDRLVAVKVMSAALSADPAFTDRFAREARAAARLSHINAVSVYDQGVDAGPDGVHVFLVMELVTGRTLRELIRERGRLSPGEAIAIMEPVLAALAAAHRAGLVHRDVKPENILLSDEGVVKVADFGLARAVESDATATRTGLMMGTVAYCAPEQITRGQADQRSDVYSAGIVLFELLTGAPPYSGDSAMTVAYQHVHSRVPAPSSRIKGIPTEIDELVVNATDSDPLGRPSDAGVFLAEVADARAALGLPVTAVPSRSRPPAARERGSASRVADAVATDVLRPGHSPGHDTVATNLAPAPYHLATPTPARQRATRAPVSALTRRRRRALVVFLLVLLLGASLGVGGWWLAAGRYSRVPDVTGDSLAAATAALKRADFKPGDVSQQFSETVVRGSVIATDPRPGSRALRGHRVTIELSKGKERFAVPKVAGDSTAQARAALAAIPVEVSTTTSTSDNVASGKVISISPAPGTEVKRGTPVTLVISTGLPTVAIPVLQAGVTTGAQAQAALRAAGFKVRTQYAFSTSAPKGTVVSSNPIGAALKFSTVTVVISKGPQLVDVPNIAPQTSVADAEAALRSVGLQYVVKTVIGGNGSIVLAISPTAGTPVLIGSTVTVYAL